MADTLADLYEELSKIPEEERMQKLPSLLRSLLEQHKRVIFNGNGYTDEWIEEAHRRGLDDLRALPDAMPRWISDKSVALFTRHQVLTKEELFSRYEMVLENYYKAIHIEALTLQEMVRKDFIQGLVSYTRDLAQEASLKRSLLPQAGCSLEEEILSGLETDGGRIAEALDILHADIRTAEKIEDAQESAEYYERTVLKDMAQLRASVDHAEERIPHQSIMLKSGSLTAICRIRPTARSCSQRCKRVRAIIYVNLLLTAKASCKHVAYLCFASVAYARASAPIDAWSLTHVQATRKAQSASYGCAGLPSQLEERSRLPMVVQDCLRSSKHD